MNPRSRSLSPSVARGIAVICAVVFVASAHTARAGINVWTSHRPGTAAIATLALDPTAPGTIYTGTYGNGVFKSTDSAANWQAIRNDHPSREQRTDRLRLIEEFAPKRPPECGSGNSGSSHQQ